MKWVTQRHGNNRKERLRSEVEGMEKIHFLKRWNPVILFIDVSMFTADPESNFRDDRYMSSLPVKDVADKHRYEYLTKVYMGILSKYVLRWIEEQYGLRPNVIFLQDGVPCTFRTAQRSGCMNIFRSGRRICGRHPVPILIRWTTQYGAFEGQALF